MAEEKEEKRGTDRQRKLYKHKSSQKERGEGGEAKRTESESKGDTPEPAERITENEDKKPDAGMAMAGGHKAERTAMNTRHETEERDLHKQHHAARRDMHARHEKERAELNKRHEKEMGDASGEEAVKEAA